MHYEKEIKHFFFKSYKYLCQSTIAQRSIELLIVGTVLTDFTPFQQVNNQLPFHRSLHSI